MQTLGLSDSTVRTESRLKSLFWPSIQSGADVDYLAVQGFWVCTLVALMSLVSLAIFGRQPVTGVLVFLLFHLGGVGVREHNPFAAGVMLFYYGRFLGNDIIYVSEFSWHWGYQSHHYRAFAIESPCHVDRWRLEGRFRRSCFATAVW